MSILRDMFTALKGGVSEAGEAIVDSQAIRIFEQNIREADEAIKQASRSLTILKGKEIKLKRKFDEISEDIADWEEKAISALDSNREDLAVKAADRIAEMTSESDSLQEEHNTLQNEVNELNGMIQQRRRTLEKNRNELERVKTTDQIQKATSNISSNFAASHSKTNRVQESLARIRKKQQAHKDNMKAGEWMEETNEVDALDKEFSDAGLGEHSSPAADDILAKLKKKAGKG